MLGTNVEEESTDGLETAEKWEENGGEWRECFRSPGKPREFQGMGKQSTFTMQLRGQKSLKSADQPNQHSDQSCSKKVGQKPLLLVERRIDEKNR